MKTHGISITQSPIPQSPDGMSLVFAPRMRRDGAAPLIGSSAVMRAVRDRIERVAATDFVTLIDGESGTGKELVARQIHEISARRRGPFVPVNCAALVETLLEAELFGIEDRTATGVRGRRGKFECADGGTLFLDEVADLSLSAQAKLLAGASGLGGRKSRRPRPASRQHACRGSHQQEALRPRGGAACSGPTCSTGWPASRSRCPPLRERREDILELAAYFLERHGDARRLTLSTSACRRAAHVRLARQRPRARAHDGAHARAGAARHDRSRRSADPHPRRLRRCAAAVDDAQRHAAGVGKSIRQARPRAKRAQQAQSVPGARHQLSHLAGVSAVRRTRCRWAACTKTRRSIRLES